MQMDLNISEKRAIITGGSKGIGREIAITLAKEGVDIVICARGKEDIEKTVTQIRSETSANVFGISGDLKIKSECDRIMDFALEKLGGVDILICSANQPGGGTFFSLEEKDWVDHMDIKFMSSIYCAKKAIPDMQKRQWGRVILISGMGARTYRPFAIDNGPVCAALSNFGKQLANQVVGDGICVNVILPGITNTPRRQERMKTTAKLDNKSIEDIEEKELNAIPTGRFIQPSEVADLTAFLCSNRAASIIGQNIAIDGGASEAVFY
tara:strand:- start:783 stop:1583 length:801 start_codon:yes stop_codon:yes gene_type:complete